MLERKFREQTEVQSGNKVVFLTEAATLEPYQQVVRIDSTAEPFTVTLPRVDRVPGMLFSFRALAANSSYPCLVQDQDESEDWTDQTLDAVGDSFVLYSDGRKWWLIASDLAVTDTTAAPTTLPPTTLPPTTLPPTTPAPTTAPPTTGG